MVLPVINKEGADTGRTVTLPDEVFGITPNEHVVYLAVKQHLANKRQGTHKSKERAEIARSTKKIKKQKGTGGARAGSTKSPVFVGGGRVFGPRPRDYSFKINKKVRVLARMSVLSSKASTSAIKVLEDLSMTTPKTKDFMSVLKNLSLNNVKTLFVTAQVNDTVYRSARNLPKTNVVTYDALNTYDILHSNVLVLSESAAKRFAQAAE
ncbi:MAG: 50S ribosomal protein L4 [Cytophagales bacterium]|nr:MAG: 50S ribosomal protein L4 [Cytophagales bacterium]TAF61953.1 MAG: 50S ribosomal protein L4 [Cytophagales bacterium]